MPLKVIIVGAAIAGLTAAIALKHGGHEVQQNTVLPSQLPQTVRGCIIGADGLHSFIRKTELDEDEATASDLSAFCFLIPTAKMDEDPELKTLLRRKSSGSSVLLDLDSHLAWFACRDGEIQNLAAISRLRMPTDHFYGTQGEYRSELLRKFEHIHPEMKGIVEAAEHVKFWPLFQRDPLQTWTYGKVLLIGDAAHPMLPFGCPGANRALEDAGALGFLLQGITAVQLPRRLDVFELVRVKRAARVQILSSVRAGEEAKVEEELGLWSEAGIVEGG